MDGRRFWIRLTGVGFAIASMAGCAMLGRNESQLFSHASRYESASITYRVAPLGPAASRDGAVLASYLAPAASGASSNGRKTTLAIRYPHPAGRAGFARVELIIQAGKSDAGKSAWMPDWLDRVHRLTQETMPGISMAEGVQEALGFDLPIADLDRLVTRLQQPIQPAAAITPTKAVLIAAKINGAPLALPSVQVAELDRLIARVRREGSLISHSSSTMDWEIDPQPGPALPQATPEVVPASYTEPATQRLPPVDTISH